MHIAVKSQQVRLLRGQLVREVSAAPRGKAKGCTPYPVFREWEDGHRESRNLYFQIISGWLYSTPEEIGREEWSADAPKCDWCLDYLSEADLALIAEARPEFRFCLRKADERGYTGAEIFRLLRAFKEDSRVELLVGAGLKSLALAPGFRRLSKRLQQDVARWALQNGDYGLRAALDCLRERISVGEWSRWRGGRCGVCYCGSSAARLSYKVWKHLDAHGIYPHEYLEYLGTLAEAGKDASDPYWGLPTDFGKRRRQAERIARNLRKAKEQAEREARRAALEKVAAKFAGGLFDGLRVWVPGSFEEVEKQAEALDQCLVSMDYASRVAAGSCVLVFVADDAGHPLATAELLPKGKGWRVGQFYGDERLDNYLAGDAERSALKLWAKANRLRLNMGRAA